MSLIDKFGIIENHLQESEKENTSKITYYIENYLNLDIHVLAPDFINQIVWFGNYNYDIIVAAIEGQIKNYLIQRRNNMRMFIKKETFEISSLNKFLQYFINKLEYLNNILKVSDNKIIIEGLQQLTNIIISDSIIILFIEEQIIMFDKDIQTSIKTLINFTKKIGKYDNSNIFYKLLKIFGNIFKKHIINVETVPLPDNIRRMHKLNETIKYCNTINTYYNFIDKDLNKINQPIVQLIMELLIEIIQNNSLYEIEIMFNNIIPELIKLIVQNDFDSKIENLCNLSNEIVYLVDRSMFDINNIFKLINIIKYLDLIIRPQTFKDIIKQKIALVLLSEKNIDSVHFNINNLITNLNYTDAIKLLTYVLNVKEKDVFIETYYQNLTKRLINKSINIDNIIDFNKYIYAEKQIYNYLKIAFGDKLVYKINKVIADIEESYENNIKFKFEKNILVLTTSYNNWDINQSEGLINNQMIESNKETILGKYLSNYQEQYKLKYSDKRILNWFLHFGEVNIVYLEQSLKMLPIHFMILEMFDVIGTIPLQTIINNPVLSNYTMKFKNDIISSFVFAGLFKIQNSNVILASEGIFKNNLIEIFLSNSDYVSIWEQKRYDELIHTREEIINANINNIIKTNTFDHESLFNRVKKEITVFELTEELFNKSIDYMIKQDYIKLNANHYEKIYY